jgi:hypothetical protein
MYIVSDLKGEEPGRVARIPSLELDGACSKGHAMVSSHRLRTG